MKGVVGSRTGVTKNAKFDAFTASQVNPHTGVTEYEGWRFQFLNESATNKFLDVCEEFAASGIDAALAKANEFEQSEVRLTTRARIVDARIGQDDFRRELMRLWKSCAVTGSKVNIALRSSHIKPWAACDSRERPPRANMTCCTCP